MKRLLARVAIGLMTLALLPHLALADDGHDHGGAAPAAAGTALPRFSAESELFELVGVLQGRQITLYLDRAADNSPVTEAQIEVDINGVRLKATRHGTDTFEVVLAEAPKPGVLPITATVSAGADTDLLAGDLDIYEAVHADEAAAAPRWKQPALWAGGLAGLAAVLAVLLAVVVTVGRRQRASRQAQAGSAA